MSQNPLPGRAGCYTGLDSSELRFSDVSKPSSRPGGLLRKLVLAIDAVDNGSQNPLPGRAGCYR